MSLDWDVSKVTDKDTVCWIEINGERTLNPVTEALIFATISVGIGEITEKTAGEFYARLRAIERGLGAFLRDGKGKRKFLTYADVRAHVGLITNVFPKESDAAFAKRLWRVQREDAEREIRRLTAE